MLTVFKVFLYQNHKYNLKLWCDDNSILKFHIASLSNFNNLRIDYINWLLDNKNVLDISVSNFNDLEEFLASKV